MRGTRWPAKMVPVIRRKLMPRSSTFEPLGTDRSAITRISSSCSASRSGRHPTRSTTSRPVRSASSSARAIEVVTFSGRKIVARGNTSRGMRDVMPGFHGPQVTVPFTSLRFYGRGASNSYRTICVVPAQGLPSSGVVGGGDPVSFMPGDQCCPYPRHWIPAFAGMTWVRPAPLNEPRAWIPAFAGMTSIRVRRYLMSPAPRAHWYLAPSTATGISVE